MKRSIYYLLLLHALVCALSIFYFDGTGDSGDSITHYLFARYAPTHPSLYFDHWAKPLFVLMASPFAQMGFVGMKVFNSLISLAVIFFTYKTAEELKIRNSIVVGILLMFSPLNYILTFSGLTEPLFALFTILGIYFCCKKKHLTASVLISFLPYIRSEGLIIIGVFVLYFLYLKMWKLFPFLLSGSFVYGIAGYFVHRDFFWVFTKIPYAKLSSVYGHGRLFHFVEELINVTGVPIYALFWIGFIGLAPLLFKKKFLPEQHILLLLGFLSFFVAHSLFWYLGIFNSMGLKRVFIGIMPIIALIALIGYNFMSEELSIRNTFLKKVFQPVILIYVIVFPFTINPSAINWEKDMMLSSDQKIARQVADLVKNKITFPLIYNHRYLSMPLNIDYFDTNQSKQISKQSISEMRPGNILIWDNLFAGFESDIRKTNLDSMPSLINIEMYTSKQFNREIVFAVYQKK